MLLKKKKALVNPDEVLCLIELIRHFDGHWRPDASYNREDPDPRPIPNSGTPDRMLWMSGGTAPRNTYFWDRVAG